MVCVVIGGFVLFSLGVQHLHEQRLRGSAAATVLQVQALLASGGYVMDVGQYGQQFGKFVLQHVIENRTVVTKAIHVNFELIVKIIYYDIYLYLRISCDAIVQQGLQHLLVTFMNVFTVPDPFDVCGKSQMRVLKKIFKTNSSATNHSLHNTGACGVYLPGFKSSRNFKQM